MNDEVKKNATLSGFIKIVLCLFIIPSGFGNVGNRLPSVPRMRLKWGCFFHRYKCGAVSLNSEQ